MGYSNVIIAIVTAFLHGELEIGEEVYMECPQGMNQPKDKVLLLMKTIYGLVQAARAFYKNLAKVLKSIGFIRGFADPCLMSRKGKKGNVYIALYVDDCLCCGHMTDIEDVIHDMKKKGFSLKVERDMTDFLSCMIQFSKKRDRLWLGQSHLLKKMIGKFGSLISDLIKFKTPRTPGLGM